MSETKPKKVVQSVARQDITDLAIVKNTHLLAMNKITRLLELTENTLNSIVKSTSHPRETCFICVTLALSALHSTHNPRFKRINGILSGLQEVFRRFIEEDEIKKNKPLIIEP